MLCKRATFLPLLSSWYRIDLVDGSWLVPGWSLQKEQRTGFVCLSFSAFLLLPADEALHKDADRLLASFEDAAGGVSSLSPHLLPQLMDTPDHIETLLSLVDAICAYFGDRSKPGSWLTLLLRLITSHSSPATRKTAVECVQLSGCQSRVFQSTLKLWGNSTNSRLLKSLLEAPEPTGGAGEEGSASRRKRSRTAS